MRERIFVGRLVSASRRLNDVWASPRSYHRCGHRHGSMARLRSARNPWSIQAESEPPGRQPPAPGSYLRRRLRHRSRSLRVAKVGWCFPRLSPVPARSLSPLRNPPLWD